MGLVSLPLLPPLPPSRQQSLPCQFPPLLHGVEQQPAREQALNGVSLHLPAQQQHQQEHNGRQSVATKHHDVQRHLSSTDGPDCCEARGQETKCSISKASGGGITG